MVTGSCAATGRTDTRLCSYTVDYIIIMYVLHVEHSNLAFFSKSHV